MMHISNITFCLTMMLILKPLIKYFLFLINLEMKKQLVQTEKIKKKYIDIKHELIKIKKLIKREKIKNRLILININQKLDLYICNKIKKNRIYRNIQYCEICKIQKYNIYIIEKNFLLKFIVKTFFNQK